LLCRAGPRVHSKADVAGILGRSEELHGKEARIRHRACLTAASPPIRKDVRRSIAPSSFPAFEAFRFATAVTRVARQRSRTRWHVISVAWDYRASSKSFAFCTTGWSREGIFSDEGSQRGPPAESEQNLPPAEWKR
jgi:hypothetical protein